MLSPSLFPIEMTSAQIAAPYIYYSPKELMHSLKQVGENLDDKYGSECSIAFRYARKKRKPYFVRFVMWPDGNWACMYDEHFRDWDIAVGQYKKAYLSSRDSGRHYYHLETNTTSDLIFHT